MRAASLGSAYLSVSSLPVTSNSNSSSPRSLVFFHPVDPVPILPSPVDVLQYHFLDLRRRALTLSSPRKCQLQPTPPTARFQRGPTALLPLRCGFAAPGTQATLSFAQREDLRGLWELLPAQIRQSKPCPHVLRSPAPRPYHSLPSLDQLWSRIYARSTGSAGLCYLRNTLTTRSLLRERLCARG